jgi:hypothetical protein
MSYLAECPGPDCLMCNGEACNKCGAGCWEHRIPPARPPCEHDVDERHEEPDFGLDGDFLDEAHARLSWLFRRHRAHMSARQGHTRKARRAARRFFRWVWETVPEAYRSRVRGWPCTPRGADRMLSWLDCQGKTA